MLESIYNIGGGKQQSPLARYLASVGGAGGGGAASPQLGAGQAPPGGQQSLPYEVGQDGNPKMPSPGATGGGWQAQFGPAGSGNNPLGPDLGKQSFDYSTDPVLQRMLSGSARDESDADAQALAARRSVLGQYGDRTLASSVLGAGDPTLDSISDNPDTSTSMLARLKRNYGQTVHDSDEAMNEGNLFYGGARVKKLGDLARDEQTQEADANTAVKQALDQIGATLGSTKAGIRTGRINAESDAANRAAQARIEWILSHPGAGDSGLPPDGSTPGGPDVGAPTTTSGGVTSAGWDAANQIPTAPDTSNMTPEQAVAAMQAYYAALQAHTANRGSAPAPPRLS